MTMRRTVYKIRWTGNGWENVYTNTPEADVVQQFVQKYEEQRESLIEEALAKSDLSEANTIIDSIRSIK